EKAPGHLDERAEAFDAALGASLRAGAPAVDLGLARELWASVDAIVELGELDEDLGDAQVDYDDAPYGVQYWVMRFRGGADGAPEAERPHGRRPRRAVRRRVAAVATGQHGQHHRRV